MNFFKIRNLKKSFYDLQALGGVSFEVREGEILGLIGPNGSGKTTLFNCVTGMLKVSGGEVLFKGREITGYKPHSIYKLGVGRTFQLVQLFPEMSVVENMLMAIQESQGNIWTRLFSIGEEENRRKALELLEFLDILHLKDQIAKNLSYGQQKLLDLGMVLMSDPELILLDEPLAGVNPSLAKDILGRISELNGRDKSFLIIEHNMEAVMKVASRIVVLDHGQKIAQGTPGEIQEDDLVLEAYFGG